MKCQFREKHIARTKTHLDLRQRWQDDVLNRAGERVRYDEDGAEDGIHRSALNEHGTDARVRACNCLADLVAHDEEPTDDGDRKQDVEAYRNAPVGGEDGKCKRRPDSHLRLRQHDGQYDSERDGSEEDEGGENDGPNALSKDDPEAVKL